MVPRDRIELPTRGFSDQIFENPKMLLFQAIDSIPFFQSTFGFVWNYLEIFDLDGHNLGTIQLWHKRDHKNFFSPFASCFLCACRVVDRTISVQKNT
jgi:hypothetical protein